MYLERIKGFVAASVGNIEYDRSIAELEEASRLDFSYIALVVLAAFIATLGLITNSAAVIIGAMIISPIMSPIMLSGASFAIMDRGKAKTASLSVGVGVVVAMICGVLTVLISPVKENTAEILARTAPNILDLFIAFFCGVAGALSVVSEKISKGVVGVAISVALMPPICVAAFGLATAQTAIAVGGFWMFFLNMAAIFVAAFAVLSLFGYSAYFESKRKKHFGVRWLLSIGLLVFISVPLALSLKEAIVYKQESELIKKELAKSFNVSSRSILQKDVIEKEDGGYVVNVFLDTVRSYDRTYIRDVEKNISSKLSTNIKLFVVQRGVLSIGQGFGAQFSIIDAFRHRPDAKMTEEALLASEIGALMELEEITSYKYDKANHTVVMDVAKPDAVRLLRLQRMLLERGVKSVVSMPQGSVLFDAFLDKGTKSSEIALLVKIADFVEYNGLAIDISVFGVGNRLKAAENTVSEIFGHNKEKVDIKAIKSKKERIVISAKVTNDKPE